MKEPTCEEEGVGAASVCERCKQPTDEVVIPALGHDWVEGGSYKKPTCTEAGYSASAECSRCHEVRADEVIPALGHDFSGSTFVKIEATCQQSGLATVYCAHSGCNVSESQVIPKKEHEFTRVKTVKAATCTEGGIIKMVCRYFCDQEHEPEEVPPLGHDWEEVSIQKAETCTEKGNRTHHCKRCDLTEQYEPDPHGHVYGDFVVDKAATASQKGTMSRQCIYCKAKSEEVVEIPEIQEQVEYSITVRRTNGKFYVGVKELKFEIFQNGTNIDTIDSTGNTTKVKISKDADSLVVTGLRKGFSTKEKYELKPGEPVVKVEIKAEMITSNHTEVNGKPQEIPPEEFIEVGDVMYDFLVRDSKGEEKWLSELMVGKELVLLDFWWTGCTICHYETSQFQRVYNDFLQPYKDKILVIMIDVMADEDSKRIEEYRQQKGYPDDFIMAMGNSEDGNVSISRKYFYDVRTPGNFWIDGEGVMFSRKRNEDYDRFKQFTLDFFESLGADELEESVQSVTVENRKITEDAFREANSRSNERYFKKSDLESE